MENTRDNVAVARHDPVDEYMLNELTPDEGFHSLADLGDMMR
jgi:glycerophosphoryl diester phosphodiesterase